MAQLTLQQVRERVAVALREAHSGNDVPPDVVTVVATHVIGAHHAIEDAPRRIDADLINSDAYYAIPDDGLDLLPSLAKAAFSIVTGGTTSALGELVGLLYRYRTLKVPIDGDDAAVLRVLKAAGRPLSAADVGERVEAAGIRLRRPVAQVLAELERRNTKATTLVETTNNRWTIGNV